MVIGAGLIANAFKHLADDSSVIIFASGVSNSSETRESEYQRETSLLLSSLERSGDKKFVYFSSCKLSEPGGDIDRYYLHKKQMEDTVLSHATNSYVCRLPQLFGELKPHPTLINYLFFCIYQQTPFSLQEGATRYVLHTEDLVSLTELYLRETPGKPIIDFANPVPYRIEEIVRSIENLCGRSARTVRTTGTPAKELQLSKMKQLMGKHGEQCDFGPGYFSKRLSYEYERFCEKEVKER